MLTWQAILENKDCKRRWGLGTIKNSSYKMMAKFAFFPPLFSIRHRFTSHTVQFFKVQTWNGISRYIHLVWKMMKCMFFFVFFLSSRAPFYGPIELRLVLHWKASANVVHSRRIRIKKAVATCAPRAPVKGGSPEICVLAVPKPRRTGHISHGVVIAFSSTSARPLLLGRVNG